MNKYLGPILLLVTATLTARASTFLDSLKDLRVAPGFAKQGSLIIDDMILPIVHVNGKASFRAARWPDGVVYYQFEFDDAVKQGLFEAAAAEWQTAVENYVGAAPGQGPIRFVARSTVNPLPENYIAVIDNQETDVNDSFVGMKGGAQNLRIHHWGNHRTILHEIGHALGLAHEHQRSDRNNYVEILWDNIKKDKTHNFDQRATTSHGAYDFRSVMHYSSTNFGKDDGDGNRLRTIEPQPNWVEFVNNMGTCSNLGPTNCLTLLDVAGMVKRYSPEQSANPPCTYEETPTGWLAEGRFHYRITTENTWMFTPTIHIQIQPNQQPFADKSTVRVLLNDGPVTLYEDADLTRPVGEEKIYLGPHGNIDLWVWADFERDATEGVRLLHSYGDNGQISQTDLIWSVETICQEPVGQSLLVSPDEALVSAGSVGGPFSTTHNTYGVFNDGLVPVDYLVTVMDGSGQTPDWLTLSRSSGSVPPGSGDAFSIAINNQAEGLPAEAHTATIRVTDAASGQVYGAVDVMLTVTGESVLPKLSGRITTVSGLPIEGVRMDGLPVIRRTDADGRWFAFISEEDTPLIIEPFKAGHGFDPPSRTYTSVTQSMPDQDFTAEVQTRQITGVITHNGAGLADVILQGLPGDPMTQADGTYTVAVPYHFTGTVTPIKSGFSFNPPSRTYEALAMTLIDERYAASQQNLSISGQVTHGGSGLADVWLAGFPGSVFTDAAGFYTAIVPPGWSDTVRPQKSGFSFTPEVRTYANVQSSLTDEHYTAATLPPGSAKLWRVTDQAQFDHAARQCREGDLILVGPGIYTDVDLGAIEDGVTLLSTSGADQTIIRANSFVLNMTDVTIDGFRFESPSASELIRIAGAINLRIRNCVFAAGAGEDGLAVFASENLLIEDCIFEQSNNAITVAGETGLITIRNSRFSQNRNGFLSGTLTDLTVVFENCLFKDHASAAIDYRSGRTVRVSNGIFLNNRDAIEINDVTQTAQITQCVFVDNDQCLAIGGGAQIELANSIMVDNAKGIDGNSSALATVHHLMFLNTQWDHAGPQYTIDEDTIFNADPLFVDAAAEDYRLTASSPAIGVGQGSHDLGAYGGGLGDDWRTPPGTPAPPPAALSFTTTGPTAIQVGEALNLSVRADYVGGYQTDHTFVAAWSSSNPTILRSDGNGRFTALAPGNADLIAELDGMSARHATTVLAANLSVTLNDHPDPALVGETARYFVTCANAGPGVARNLRLTLDSDDHLAFVTANPQPDQGTDDVWTLGDLAPGASVVLEIETTVSPSLLEGALLTSTATLEADFHAPVHASEMTNVMGQGDLAIELSSDKTSVSPGENLTLTATVDNLGSGVVRGAHLQIAYPINAAFITASPSPDQGDNRWELGDLDPGEHRVFVININAREEASSGLIIAAMLNSDTTDMDSTNDQATVAVDVICGYVVGADVLAFDASGGSMTTSLTTTSGCAWTAFSNETWISVVSGFSGTGSGDIVIETLPNVEGVARSGSIIVQGETITIIQTDAVSALRLNGIFGSGDFISSGGALQLRGRIVPFNTKMTGGDFQLQPTRRKPR